jgi:hypothetical protein
MCIYLQNLHSIEKIVDQYFILETQIFSIFDIIISLQSIIKIRNFIYMIFSYLG